MTAFLTPQKRLRKLLYILDIESEGLDQVTYRISKNPRNEQLSIQHLLWKFVTFGIHFRKKKGGEKA